MEKVFIILDGMKFKGAFATLASAKEAIRAAAEAEIARHSGWTFGDTDASFWAIKEVKVQ